MSVIRVNCRVLQRFVGGLRLAVLAVLFAAATTDRAAHANGIAPISITSDRIEGPSEHDVCDHTRAAACASLEMHDHRQQYAAGRPALAMTGKNADTERTDGLRPPPLQRPPRTLS